MNKKETEVKVKKAFKNLKKRHKLDYLSVRQALELSAKLQTEAGEKLLRKCINACVINSERLSKDAEAVSGPTKSALLELAFEEAAKAYMICVVYLELFRVKNKPIWADYDELDYSKAGNSKDKKLGPISSFLQYIKLVHGRSQYMNNLYSIFRDHDLKVLLPLMGVYAYHQIPEFEEKLVAILRRRKVPESLISEKMPLVKDKIKLLVDYKHLNYSKIKSNGLYVDFNFKSLEFYVPKSATKLELGEISRNIEIALRCAKSFLRAIEEK